MELSNILQANYLSEISDLKKRVSDLEKKSSSSEMFGRSYNSTGNLNSDFLIKTKGQVKVLFGSKFIDLIKDGKINVESSFIFKVKDFSKIGSKEGIYILEDGSIYLIVGDSEPINLVGEVGNTYVSFLGNLETNSELKYTALTNIGFLYSNISEVDSSALKNGIIYIESDLKLYIVKDGNLSEYVASFPNPFTELFIIHKNDDKQGSLVIKGFGIENSLAFNLVFLYEEEGSFKIDVNGTNSVNIGSSSVEINTKLLSDNIYSLANNGFRLYMLNGESYLEVDHLDLRKQTSVSEADELHFLPQYWLSNNNIINETETYVSEDVTYVRIYLKYSNTYKVNDILYTYEKLEDNSYSPIKLKVLESEGNNIVILNSSITDPTDLNSQIIFLVKSSSGNSTLRLSSGNIDIVKNLEQHDGSLTETIKTRIGNLEDLNYAVEGIYSKNGIIEDIKFKEVTGSTWTDIPQYSANLNLLLILASNKSSNYGQKIPSIDWVKNYVDMLSKPGYYWSSDILSGLPINPIYLGTDSTGFSVSASQPYLWYTTDGITFTLKALYISPSTNRIYILSTGLSEYLDNSSGKYYRYPAGFICYYYGGTVECGYGTSNYIPIESVVVEPTLSKLQSLLTSALSGNVPEKEGYGYVWSIDADYDMSVIYNWKLEASLGMDIAITKTISNADWGNMTTSPGFNMFIVNSLGIITSTSVPESIFKAGYGNTEHWLDDVWRKSFLRHILSRFLYTNKHRYNENTGWYLNYDGIINCFGYEGSWNARVGGILAPTSDDPGDLGYKTTAVLSNVSGWTMGNGNLVHFQFENVRLGDLLNLAQGLNVLQVGATVTNDLRYYDVSYDNYYVTITPLQSNAIT